MEKYKIDKEKADLTNSPKQAFMTFIFFLVIFALLIACFYLYARSLANRMIEYEKSKVPTGTEVCYDYGD